MAAVDWKYVDEILAANKARTKNVFYRECQKDINAGYLREVNAAWRHRVKEIIRGKPCTTP